MTKHTLILTQQCNLRCRYCYVDKRDTAMPAELAARIVDFAFAHTPAGEKVDIGYFGGEPLLEFPLLRDITATVKRHPDYRRERVVLSVISNGTVYSNAIADYLSEQEIHLCMSCDGPPAVQDAARRYRSGRPTSATVEKNIRRAAARFPDLRVNAVFGPATLHSLPDTVDYLASLGVTQIYLNPDYSAAWSAANLADLPEVYAQVGETYIRHRMYGPVLYVSMIDSKIAVILRGGYQPGEMCRMGTGEFAYTPGGWVYPCERLVGAGDGGDHCIGHVDSGLRPSRSGCSSATATNSECTSCGLQRYCMRWCGCSNFFASGRYDRVSPFLCASERAAINVAFDAFRRIEEQRGPTFFEHVSGLTHADSTAAGVVFPPLPSRGQPVRFIQRYKGDPSNG
jgi:uncharacterized protein